MPTDIENLAALVSRIDSATNIVVTINTTPVPTPLDFTAANSSVDALDAAIQTKVTPAP